MLANNHELPGMVWMMMTKMDILQELRGFSVHRSNGSRKERKLGVYKGLVRVTQHSLQVYEDSISIHLRRTHILDHSGSRSPCTGIGVTGIFPRRSETGVALVRLGPFVPCIFCSSIDLHRAFKMG